MKKIVVFMIAIFAICTFCACNKTVVNEDDVYLYNVIVEKTHQHLPSATISEEFTDTEKYRMWTATNGEEEFQIVVPIKYVGHKLTEDEKLELSLDIGDNYNFHKLQKVLKKYPELGVAGSNEFDYAVASETEATQNELNNLYATYLKALNKMGRINFITRVKTSEGEVLFTPYY